MAASKARIINGETTLTVNMLSIGEGAFSIDQRQRIVSWNETATQLLGYTGEEVLGKPCHRVLGACDKRTMLQFCKHHCQLLRAADMHLMDSESPHFELRVIGRDGREHWLNITLLPAYTGTGEARVVHLLHDVSEQHYLAAHAKEAGSSDDLHEFAASPAPTPADEQTQIGPRPSLTRREHEVLHLLACGLANGEIAGKLGISPITARNHVTNVIEKLHVRTRLQAVVVASQLGLL
ncbi:MAG TPA: PAS and helix-turn-helix domain-containing protein [Ktedonobacterales bacterium]